MDDPKKLADAELKNVSGGENTIKEMSVGVSGTCPACGKVVSAEDWDAHMKKCFGEIIFE